MVGIMTNQDWDRVKTALSRLHEMEKELWLEKVLMRNLIIDSGWMPESDLDAALEHGKNHPENLQQMEVIFAPDEDRLARLGLDDWLAEFEKRYPRSN